MLFSNDSFLSSGSKKYMENDNLLYPSMSQENAERYLRLSGLVRRKPSLEALKERIEAHVLKVPFENLSKLYHKAYRNVQSLPSPELFLRRIENFIWAEPVTDTISTSVNCWKTLAIFNQRTVAGTALYYILPSKFKRSLPTLYENPSGKRVFCSLPGSAYA